MVWICRGPLIRVERTAMGPDDLAAGAFAGSIVFLRYFDDLVDPRQRGKVKDPLDEILLLCLLAVLAGADCIAAIPKLLAMMAIEGAIVTIDAMGRQREIAQIIIDKKADDILELIRKPGNPARHDVGPSYLQILRRHRDRVL